MAKPFQSEIRESTIRELLQKVKLQKYGNYLRKGPLAIRAVLYEATDGDFAGLSSYCASGHAPLRCGSIPAAAATPRTCRNWARNASRELTESPEMLVSRFL